MTDSQVTQPLSIRTFGALAVTLGDEAQPIRFATHTVAALLVYLACQDRPVGRDELAELLWPERTQEQSRMNLRVALHRLRAAVEPYLLITRQTLALNPQAVIHLDVRQFERHLTAGQLAQATALYRGDFLAGFYLDASPAFEQWALLERERLRTLALAAYQQLVDQHAATGQLEAATACAQRLLQLDPLHEPTHRQLMRLLAQAGQRSAALAQYESCRQLLAAEFGVPPDEATTLLYQQLREGGGPATVEQSTKRTAATAAGNLPPLAADFTPTGPPALVPHNLPPQPTPLIGRGAELAHIDHLLANPDCRLLTLLGTGGIGKTRLAVETAERVVAGVTATSGDPTPFAQECRFPQGACYISLAAVENAELVLTAIAQALGLQLTGGDLQAGVVAYLQPRTLLLVLDNFEHLLGAADSVAHLLQHAPGLKVLVTSRERLYLREEWLLPVAGLSLAEELVGEAGQLFLRSAQRVQPGFSAQGQEQAIMEICAQVEGMPLAVELAASWVRVMPCTEIAQQVTQNSHIFTTTLRNLPERHRSLASLFDQSWRLLSPLEQGVLRRVSVFRGGWTLEAAVQVAGATLPLLLGLVDKSLVRTNGQGRFDLHELVRQYAAEQLFASDELAEAQRGHALYFLALAQAVKPSFVPEEGVTLDRLLAEHANLQMALAWSLADNTRWQVAAGIAIGMLEFWLDTGQWSEARRWIESALTITPEHTAARAKLLVNAGVVAVYLNDPVVAHERLAEGLELATEQGVHFYIGHVHLGLGWLAEGSGDYEQALVHLGEALAIYRAFGGRAAGAGCLVHLAGVRMKQHDYAGALVLHEEALTLFQAAGIEWEVADVLHYMGMVARRQGDYKRAWALFRESLARWRVIGTLQWKGIPECLTGLAEICVGQLQFVVAAQLMGSAWALWAMINPGSPTLSTDAAGSLASFRDYPDAAACAAAWKEGHSCTPAQAVEYALNLPDLSASAPADVQVPYTHPPPPRCAACNSR